MCAFQNKNKLDSSKILCKKHTKWDRYNKKTPKLVYDYTQNGQTLQVDIKYNEQQNSDLSSFQEIEIPVKRMNPSNKTLQRLYTKQSSHNNEREQLLRLDKNVDKNKNQSKKKQKSGPRMSRFKGQNLDRNIYSDDELIDPPYDGLKQESMPVLNFQNMNNDDAQNLNRSGRQASQNERRIRGRGRGSRGGRRGRSRRDEPGRSDSDISVFYPENYTPRIFTIYEKMKHKRQRRSLSTKTYEDITKTLRRFTPRFQRVTGLIVIGNLMELEICFKKYLQQHSIPQQNGYRLKQLELIDFFGREKIGQEEIAGIVFTYSRMLDN